MDNVEINIVNQATEISYIYHQYKDCEKCPLHQIGNTMLHQSMILKDYYQSIFAVSLDNKDYMNVEEFKKICQNAQFLDSSIKYNLVILPDFGCSLETVSIENHSLLPMLSFLVFYITLFFSIFYTLQPKKSTSQHIWSPYSRIDNQASNASNSAYREFYEPFPIEARRAESKTRIRSVDVFRGITIFLMIFVNYGAGEYQELKHAAWDGLNLADIVFPFFIFIMGVSIAISMKNIIVENFARLLLHFGIILKRSLRLFILGLFINSCGNPNFYTLRIPGVLQRFAFCYCLVSATHILSKYLRYHCLYQSFVKVFQAFPYFVEFILGFSSLLLHVGLTYFWRYSSDCPVGYTGPGGLGDEMKFVNCTGGAAKAIDQFLFGKDHCYKRFFGSILYDPNNEFGLWHDPEGFLGSWTSIILTLIGFSFGKILLISFVSEQEYIVPQVDVYVSASQRARIYNADQINRSQKASTLFRYRLRTGILVFLCFGLFVITKLFFRIGVNKQLWSLSFIFLTGGMAVVSLFILNGIITNYCTAVESNHDAQSAREVNDDANSEDNNHNSSRFNLSETLIWPFECAGKNAILLYVGHEIIKKMLPFSYVVSANTVQTWGHLPFLISNLFGAACWVLISALCDSWQLYFKI